MSVSTMAHTMYDILINISKWEYTCSCAKLIMYRIYTWQDTSIIFLPGYLCAFFEFCKVSPTIYIPRRGVWHSCVHHFDKISSRYTFKKNKIATIYAILTLKRRKTSDSSNNIARSASATKTSCLWMCIRVACVLDRRCYPQACC